MLVFHPILKKTSFQCTHLSLCPYELKAVFESQAPRMETLQKLDIPMVALGLSDSWKSRDFPWIRMWMDNILH